VTRSKKQKLWDDLAREIRKQFSAALELHEKQKNYVGAKDAWLGLLEKIENAPEDFKGDDWVREVKGDLLFNTACAYAALGEKGSALDTLEMSVGAGFLKRGEIEADKHLASLRDTQRFKDVIAAIEEKLGPLTISRVVKDSIKQGTLTKEGIDSSIGADAMACVVYHHEWIRSPELKGVGCLMLASLPDGSGGVRLVHDTGGKTLFPANRLDGEKIKFVQE
jgi:hypothetical protein